MRSQRHFQNMFWDYYFKLHKHIYIISLNDKKECTLKLAFPKCKQAMSSDEMILLLIIYIFGIIVNICLFYQDIQLYGSSACLFCWPLSAITTVCATYVDYGDIHIPVGLSMSDTHK